MGDSSTTNPETRSNEQKNLTGVAATNLLPQRRKKILDFHKDDQDIIMRVYKLRQPSNHEFSCRLFGEKLAHLTKFG